MEYLEQTINTKTETLRHATMEENLKKRCTDNLKCEYKHIAKVHKHVYEEVTCNEKRISYHSPKQKCKDQLHRK